MARECSRSSGVRCPFRCARPLRRCPVRSLADRSRLACAVMRPTAPRWKVYGSCFQTGGAGGWRLFVLCRHVRPQCLVVASDDRLRIVRACVVLGLTAPCLKVTGSAFRREVLCGLPLGALPSRSTAVMWSTVEAKHSSVFHVSPRVSLSQNERAEQLALRGRLAGVAPSRRRCTPCKTRYVGIPGSPGGCPGVSDDAR